MTAERLAGVSPRSEVYLSFTRPARYGCKLGLVFSLESSLMEGEFVPVSPERCPWDESQLHLCYRLKVLLQVAQGRADVGCLPTTLGQLGQHVRSLGISALSVRFTGLPVVPSFLPTRILVHGPLPPWSFTLLFGPQREEADCALCDPNENGVVLAHTNGACGGEAR